MSTKLETITKFNLYMDDTSELSSTEEGALYDKIYNKISTDRPWEGTKSSATGTLSTTLPYVSLPSNFAYLVSNQNYSRSGEYGAGPAILVGTDYTPYKVVSWSDRRQYRDAEGYAYVDFANSRLYFTKQPTSALSYEFDYHAFPTALANGDSPWFPEQFHDVIYHGMCVDSFVMQQSDKAKSYAKENQQMYQEYLDKMAFWNAQLIQTE
jgi:hypothetical protein